MPRQIRPHQPTWLDRAFVKDFKKLPRGQQNDLQRRLADLIEALRHCAHPVTDPIVKRWHPSPYHVTGGSGGGRLVEYRFPGTVRVIVCYFETDAGRIGEPILLVAATLKHGRLKRLIESSDPASAPKDPEP